MIPAPPARAVDWAILVVLALQAATGVGTIFAGTPESAWLIVLHAIGGLVLVVLIGLKLWRVRHRLRPGRFRRDMVPAVLAAMVVLATMGSGIAWASGWRPWVGLWTLLTIHAVLGLLLLIPVLIHLTLRIHRPRAIDFADRRTALQFAALAGVGTLAWGLQRQLTRVLEVPSRFTGSYETRSFEGNAFPSTSWVADDPEPIDPSDWELIVDGAVEDELALSESKLIANGGPEAHLATDGGAGTDLTTEGEAEASLTTDGGAGADIRSGAAIDAVLDCTSGWYSEQRWQGVSVASLLDAATPTDEARWVSFHSVTGYRWSLPMAEAADALLATHVTGERLSHEHGYPLRLVAPGRRGFQWVKWIERVEVRTTPDYGQWIAIFTSGFE